MSNIRADMKRLESSGRWFAITPNDSTDLPNGVTRAIYVGAAGDVIADSENGQSSILFTNLMNGFHPLRVKRVRATGTTATGLVAIY